MKKEVDASEMHKVISKKGFTALYIDFKTDKSIIKPASAPVIDQAVQKSLS